jgi:hypothetical protein
VVRNDDAIGINMTQLFGVFFIRWRIIGAAIGAAFAIALITGGVFRDSSDNGLDAVPNQSSYTATAVYGVVPVDDSAVPLGEIPWLTQAPTQTFST